jgi:hypothetical protein
MGSRLLVSAFDPFLEVLRDNRFPVGLSHRLRLLQALDAWEGSYPPHRLRTLLCPIFATDAEEQRLFYDLFEQHLPHFASVAMVTPSQGGPPPVTPERPDARPARGGGRRLHLIVAVFAALALTLIAFGLWHFRDPGSPQLPRAPVAPSWSLTPPYRPPPLQLQPQSSVNERLRVPANPSKPSTGLGWTGLLLIPAVLWGLIEAWAWRRRQAIVARGASQPITLSSFRRVVLPVRTAAQAGFAATLRRLRRPTPGPLRLHLGKTVASTIRATGFPEFRYEPVFRRPEYLVLIDRISIRDHQAAFFEELVADLDRRGLRVAAYNFSGDPRVCRPVKTGRSVYLADLSYRTAEHRLIVFGEGDRLLSDRGDVAPAGSVLLRWRQRGILTPREPEHWGRREFHLARHFLLLQATSGSLAASVDYFDPDHNVRLRRPESGFDHREPDLERATPTEIRRVLGDDGLYRWLCACALYPQLQWDLTLQLGAKLGPDLLGETNLEKLVRLPWFRRGSIPVSLQQALAESLDAPARLHLRAAILELLEHTPPAPDGPAGDGHRLEIAIQRLDILPEERRRILDDEAAARVVAEADVPPGALVASPALRRALFPHGLPTLGFRAGARRAFALFSVLAIVCIAGLAWWFRRPGRGQGPNTPSEAATSAVQLGVGQGNERSAQKKLGFPAQEKRTSQPEAVPPTNLPSGLQPTADNQAQSLGVPCKGAQQEVAISQEQLNALKATRPPASVLLYDNFNRLSVTQSAGPPCPTAWVLSQTSQITQLATYHWNNGLGVPPGTISLKSDSATYGPYHAVGYDNATWLATANVILSPGTYSVADSDPSTWSYNDQSGRAGFVRVWGWSAVPGNRQQESGVSGGGAQQEVAIGSKQLREAGISKEELSALKANCSKLGTIGFELDGSPARDGLGYFASSIGLRSSALRQVSFRLGASSPNGLVTGRVVDLTREPLPAAQIWLLNPTIGFCRAQLTSTSGTFTFVQVPPGRDYLVEVEKTGFVPQFRTFDLEVQDQKLLIPGFVLQPVTPSVTAGAGGLASSGTQPSRSQQAQEATERRYIHGIVVTLDAKPVAGATVQMEGSSAYSKTTDLGEFEIPLPTDTSPADPITLSVLDWAIVSPLGGRISDPSANAQIAIVVKRAADNLAAPQTKPH